MTDTTPGAISLSYTHHSGSNDKSVTISIEDRISGCRILELELSLVAFAEMLSSLSSRPCTLEFNPYNFGKIREVKEEIVSVPDGPWKKRDEIAATALKQFEVDGWQARSSDATNHHRAIGSRDANGLQKYRVTFTRFVDPTPEQLAARLAEIKEHDA